MLCVEGVKINVNNYEDIMHFKGFCIFAENILIINSFCLTILTRIDTYIDHKTHLSNSLIKLTYLTQF